MSDWLDRLSRELTRTGDLSTDVPTFLLGHGLPRVAAHVAQVAAEARRIALLAGVDPEQAATAAWLHDISAPIPNAKRVEVCRGWGLEVLPAEEQFPMLLHQKQSTVIARELFGVTDEAVLAAIGCHTALRKSATLLDKVLYLADKLAWDQEGAPPYGSRVAEALNQSVDAAVRVLLEWFYQNRASLKVVHPWLKGAYVDATGSAWGLSLRDVTDADYDGVAAVANSISPEPNAAEEMRDRDRELMANPEYSLRRIVALTETGRVAGYAVANCHISTGKGEWYAWVGIHPEERGQGIGTTLSRAVEAWVREQAGRKIDSRIMGGDDAAFDWALRRGYQLKHQRTESVLDLTTWDGSRWGGHLDRLRAGGLHLVTISRIPPELYREVYDCDVETNRDHPEYEGDDPIYEDWLRFYTDESKPKVFALAQRGDRVVGYSFISLPTLPGESAYTNYTCVRRDYRGRGVALGTKLLTIEAAIAHGVTRMRTNNNPENGPMLAVNEKLGYQLIPGPRTLIKTL